MRTKELENKLKISENTCIHCPTLELAKQVLNIFHQLGLKWCDGTHYTICTKWDRREEDTVYHPFDGEFSSLEFACLTGYKIINAEEFIALHNEEQRIETMKVLNILRSMEINNIDIKHVGASRNMKELAEIGFIQGYTSNEASLWWNPNGKRLLFIRGEGVFSITDKVEENA